MVGLVTVVVGVGGCGNGDRAETVSGPLGQESSELVPDIDIEDVNPSSPFFGATISPRRFLGQVSAWYFGHST